ncbi:unnamed protein product [Peniophora sp. CBMAI 1063]|nr:unnamed protein product [Peniophora sp. CBMAI 1063]
MPPWNGTKAKVQLRLSVQRLRTLQEKKEAQAKMARRDVAMLLERGKIETARIKVENIINEDVYLELLELLELYCELLIARFGLLDQNSREPDAAVSEGVNAVIHAAPRTELKELHILRDLLMHKYGREYSAAIMENRDGVVSERVTKKLVVETPPAVLVNAYLSEIAKGYGVKWSPPEDDVEEQVPSTDDVDDTPDGGVKEPTSPLDAEHLPPGVGVSDSVAREGRKTPRLPELPPTEDEIEGTKEASAAAEDKKAVSEKGKVQSKPAEPEDDFTMLAKRFEALKKR